MNWNDLFHRPGARLLIGGTEIVTVVPHRTAHSLSFGSSSVFVVRGSGPFRPWKRAR